MTNRSVKVGFLKLEGLSFEILSESELAEIHRATLEILRETGVKITSRRAREILTKAGAETDHSREVVKFPPHLVERAIQTAPEQILLAGRNPDYDVEVGGNNVYFTNFGSGINIVDPKTGDVRNTTKEDVADTARLVDYLSDIDVYSLAVTARDCPENAVYLHATEAYLNNTSKHCHGFSGKNADKCIAMGAAVAGGEKELRRRPIISADVCPQSPLQLMADGAQVIMDCARAGVPVTILPAAMAGATSPVTLAGTLVGHNAEVLVGLTLAQQVEEGAPVMYGSSTTMYDVKENIAAVGSPELALCSAALARIARYYKLPSYLAGG